MKDKQSELSILEDIGLTGAEIKVFMTLLELGPSVAGEVIKKSKLQSAVVHRAFNSLSEKGLLSYVYKGSIKIYQPIEPEQLIEFLDEKKNQVEKIMPILKKRQELAKKKSNATIFEGINGVKKLLTYMAKTNGKEYLAYGGPVEAQEMLGELFYGKLHKEKAQRGIKSKLIFHKELKAWGKEIEKFGNINVKFTNKGLEGITETVLCGDKVAIIVFTEIPFGFLIEEREAYESYKKFFDFMWKSIK